MQALQQTVFVVDDDGPVRDSLDALIRSIGIEVEAFASAEAFLEAFDPSRAGCLVLDVRMPGIGGLELQKRLRAMNARLPIIFITGHGDIPMAVQALREGAMDFLEKPFRHQELLEQVQQALAQDQKTRQALQRRDLVMASLEKLTPRETEVMEKIVEGKQTKIIARELGISQKTAEIHRARVMEKTEARSAAHLVRMVLRAREPI